MIKRPATALVLVLVVAACGGGGDSGGEQQATQTTVTTAAAAPVRSQAGSVLDPADLTSRCLSYAAYAGTLGLAVAAAINPSAAADLEALKSQVKLDEAPGEIRDDFEAIIGYAQGLGEILARFNLHAGQYDAEAIAAMSTYTAGIDQTRLQEAGENIKAWVAAYCPK